MNMEEIGEEKGKAATKSSRSLYIRVSFWSLVFLLVLALAAYCCDWEYSLLGSIPLELLPNLSKESVFLSCVLILLFVLIDAGCLGRRDPPEIPEGTQSDRSDSGSSSNEAEFSIADQERMEEQEQVQDDGDDALQATDWEDVDDDSCGEEFRRRCDEYISNFRRTTTIEL